MEQLKEFLREIIRPIVMEAVHEAFVDKKANPPKRYYTREEAQDHLRISRATFYRNVKKGRIEILKIGNKSLIDADKLDGAVQRREVYR